MQRRRGQNPETTDMRRIWWTALLIVLVPAAAYAAPGAPERATRTMFKGYELYSYRARNEWRFVVLEGTNRNKSIEEVATAPAMTLEELKRRMEGMAVGENVSWCHENVVPKTGSIRLEYPDSSLRQALKKLAKRLQIQMYLP